MHTQVNRLTDSWLKFTYAKYSQGCQFTTQTQIITTKHLTDYQKLGSDPFKNWEPYHCIYQKVKQLIYISHIVQSVSGLRKDNRYTHLSFI